MVRLKFLLFALLVLALWVGHVLVISPSMTARAVEQAAVQARSSARVVEGELARQTVELSRTALAVARTGRMDQVARAAPADRATQLASAVAQLAGDGTDALVAAAGNDAGGNFVRVGGDQAGEKVDVDATLLARPGGPHVADVGDTAYVFVTFPLTFSSDGKVTTTAAIGAPLARTGAFAEAARRSGLAAVALTRGGKVVASGGADAAAATRLSGLADKVAPGTAEVIERRAEGDLFGLPLPLPAWSEGRMGEAPSMVAAREAIEGTPYEVIAVASTAASARALADYQRLAIPIALALLLLSLFWLVWIGRGVSRADRAPRTVAATSTGAVPVAAEASREPGTEAHASQNAYDDVPEAASGDFQAVGSTNPGYDRGAAELTNPRYQSGSAEGAADAQFGSPEDAFPFGADAAQQPASDFPFGDPPQTVPTAASPVAPSPEFEQPTRAYPAEPGYGYEQADGGGDNPDATRVAMIPQELLDASSRPSRTDHAAVRPGAARGGVQPPPPAVAQVAGSEEQHFQDVYREFVATRDRCGEPPDGLTYDRFVQKLRRNKEQLVQKYNCRTVRFQVYVKDGKAALKATPVKD